MSLLKVSTRAGGTNDTTVMGKEAEDDSLDLFPVGLRDEEAIGNDFEALCEGREWSLVKVFENDLQEGGLPFL